jgi:hypothetical protein
MASGFLGCQAAQIANGNATIDAVNFGAFGRRSSQVRYRRNSGKVLLDMRIIGFDPNPPPPALQHRGRY